MKIIKENKNFGFPMRIVCKRVVDVYGFAYGKDIDFCGSELEIDKEDIKKHDWSKYPNYSGTDYGVICPVCGKFIVIDENIIPKQVKENALSILVG